MTEYLNFLSPQDRRHLYQVMRTCMGHGEITHISQDSLQGATESALRLYKNPLAPQRSGSWWADRIECRTIANITAETNGHKRWQPRVWSSTRLSPKVTAVGRFIKQGISEAGWKATQVHGPQLKLWTHHVGF